MRETQTHQVGAIDALSFVDGPFAGIIFTYSKVQLLEKDDTGYLKFDYDIVENNCAEFDKELFETALGDHLVDLLRQGLDENTLIYAGGK